MRRLTNVAFVVWAAAVSISLVSGLFTVMRWQMDSLLLLLALAMWVLGTFAFCISGLFEWHRLAIGRQRILPWISAPLVVTAAVLILLSVPMKVLHWVGADLLLLLSALSVLIAFPVLLIASFQSGGTARLTFIQLGMIAMLLSHSGVALNALHGGALRGEVLTGYRQVRNGLFITNEGLHDLSDDSVEAIRERAGTDTTDRSVLTRAETLQTAADSAYRALEEAYVAIVTESGSAGIDPETNLPEPTNLRDRDSPHHVMINQGVGARLKTALERFREVALQSCTVAEEQIPLQGKDPVRQGYEKETWEVDNFSEVPAVAALAVIAKLMNDVRTTENIVLQCLKEEIAAQGNLKR